MSDHHEHHPLWLRSWHWLNVLFFLTLVVTGISLHFSAPGASLIAFDTARVTHNVAGILMTINTLFYMVATVVSGNIRYYIPDWANLLSGLFKQVHFYGVGIFKGDPPPFPITARDKFNPLQQVTYLSIMFLMVPVLILSGLLFFFPNWLPDQFMGFGGLWPVALIHTLVGLFLTLFMLGHIYLATAGETITTEFRKMIFGR